MPVSRNRKKKSKKKKKASNDRTYTKNGLRFKLRANEVSIHNIRTPEEQQAYNEQLPARIEQVTIEIDKMFNRLLELFDMYDKLYLLGYVARNHYLKQRDSNDDAVSETILEYALSIASASENTVSKIPERHIFEEVIDVLEDIRQAYLAKEIMVSGISRTTNSDNPFDDTLNDLKFNAVINSITIRGNGYDDHVEKVFLDLFSQHDDFLREHYGFSAKDLYDVFIELERDWKLRTLFPQQPIPDFHFLDRFSSWAFENRIFPPTPTKENLADFFRANLDINPDILRQSRTLDINKLEDLKDFYKIKLCNERQRKVVEHLSLRFTDNASFLLPPAKGHLLADSLIYDKPILRDKDGDYYLFSFHIPLRNLIPIGEDLTKKADLKYYEEYYLGKKRQQTRDNTFERMTENVFKTFLPEVEFHLNVSYPLKGTDNVYSAKEKTELDLLGIGHQYTYLIEIKAGGFNNAAKRGAPGSIKTRLNKNVGEGISQTIRAITYVLESSPTIFQKNGGGEIVVDKTKPIFRIVVTLDPFAGALTKVSDLQITAELDKGKEFPWIVNIYDLLIFSEILETEHDLVDYLNKRLPLNALRQFSTQDEINLLGHFLEFDLNFDKHNKLKYDHFTLGNHLNKITAYFNAKRVGSTIPKPKRKHGKNK